MSTETITVERMKYHGPGWNVNLLDGTVTFQVWAPGGERHRPEWRAGWIDTETEGGNYAAADTFAEATRRGFSGYNNPGFVAEIIAAIAACAKTQGGFAV